jgi:hypothetical protein
MSLRYWSCIAAFCFVGIGDTRDAQFAVPSPPEVRSQNHIAL